MQRLPNESMQQYRGRQKREMNAANDALNLTVGEPVQYGGRRARFELRMIDRVSPSRLTRLEGDDLTAFLAKEKIELDRQADIRERQDARNIFFARQEAKDAQSIRCILEDGLEAVIDRLTPAEWAEFRKRLEA